METKKNSLWIRLMVVVTFVAMVAVNALANTLPLNGIDTGAVSNAYPNLFAPAAYTFAIWGAIYVLLGTYTLYALGLFHSRDNPTDGKLLRRVGIVFSISSLINAAWIFSWHYLVIPVSMVLMVLLLICLIYIRHTLQTQDLGLREKLFIRLPFSIYLGWITVATIANATTLLVSLKWDGFGMSESLWTVIMLAVGAVIGIATAIRYKDAAYNLVLIWAYTGILVKHASAQGFAHQYPAVIIAAWVCIALFVLSLTYVIIRPRRKAA